MTDEMTANIQSKDSAIPVMQGIAPGEQRALSFGYYSVKEVAKIIGFHPDTVYDWIASKHMPTRRSGKRGRITVYWPEFVKWWSEFKTGEG